MEAPARRRFRREHQAAIVLIVTLVVMFAFWMRGDRAPLATDAAPSSESVLPAPAAAPGSPEALAGAPGAEATVLAAPYDIAHLRVEEDRGEPMGQGARVSIPDELNHYTDRRRFLAVQMANAREEEFELPQDEADLVVMLRAGKLVELPLLTDDFILDDVGTDASADPMEAYDAGARKNVPLFPSAAALDAERAMLAERMQNAGSRRERTVAESRLRLISSYYDDPAWRERLLRKGADVTALAADFGGVAYDLRDPLARAQFEVRLLRLVRPEARDLVYQLAREYRERFGRQLPITSLIRSERYQRSLSRVNANATKVEFPPHATGSAFDISYRYMSGGEQQLLYDRIAQLEREGKVEALRERRNHIHVFVFENGQRPPEGLVAQFLDEVDDARALPAAPVRRTGARRAR
jgi:hypothetical protein